MSRATEIHDFPLSPSQERIWFLWRLRPKSDEFNVVKAVLLRGRLDNEALFQALHSLVERHSILRASFPSIDGKPVLRTHASQPVPVDRVDLRHLPTEERQHALATEVDRVARTPFDLTEGPLFRAGLIRLADDEHALVLTTHHIVTDGVSMGLLDQELPLLYRAAAHEGPAPPPPPGRPYRELAAEQARRTHEAGHATALAHWRVLLAGAPARSVLPPGAPGGRTAAEDSTRHVTPLPAELAERVDDVAAQCRATRFLVLLSVYAVLLARMSSADDVVIGVPMAGRTSREEETVFGMFVNVLPLRVRVSPRMTFADLVTQVRDTFVSCLEFQDTPLQLLVDELRPERSAAQHPFFQTVFAYEEAPEEEAAWLPGLTVTELPPPPRTAAFDLTMTLVWRSEGAQVRVEHRPDACDAATAVSAAARYAGLLAAAATSPTTPVVHLPFLLPGEEQTLRRWSTGEALTAPPPRTVDRLVERHARERPDAIAVRTVQRALSYGELNRSADEAAAGLRAAGAGPGTLVATWMPRGTHLVTALLAIAKSGAAYVPLDPAQPLARTRMLLDETSPVLVLAEEAAAIGDRCAVTLADLRPPPAGPDGGRNPLPDAGPGASGPPADRPAYVIHTSGSTGRPKAVLVGHRSLARLVAWHHEEFGVVAGDRVTMLAAPAFDASTWEIWAGLTAGATLEVPPAETVLSPADLRTWLVERRITGGFLPTPLLQRMTSQPWPQDGALRTVLTGGDRLHAVTGGPLPFRLVNNYGPTEATVVATSATVRTADPAAPPIGRPLPGVTAHVLDPELTPVPVGVTGELHLGGAGLALGYLGRPAFTAERFVPDPFGRTPGARLYRTGDLVRWRPDGTLDYLGRNDRQLKVRGFRIEPGEVEHALSSHPALADAVVLLQDERLTACLVLADRAQEPSPDELMGHLTGLLPRHMCPQRYAVLPELPLTAQGKVDRSRVLRDAVPIRGSRPAGRPATGARSDAERQVTEVWADALGHAAFGPSDNFFDVGGDSLLLASVAERLSALLRRPVPVTDLYEHPTVEAFARRLSAPPGSARPARTGGAAPGPAALFPAVPRSPDTGQGADGPSATGVTARPAGPRPSALRARERPLHSKRRTLMSRAIEDLGDETDIETRIAVVGMACRFPGARTPEEFWRNLVEGVDSVRDITARELAQWGEDPTRLDEPRYVASHGVVADVGAFDAPFFQISERDAALLNPQHRVFLELAWEALERAGYDPGDAPGPVGLFAGAGRNGYGLLAHTHPDRFPGVDELSLSLANEPEHLVTRVSYLLGLTGPSVAVQSACSTSLVAVHEASRALLGGECDTALAGGVSLRVPMTGYWYREGGTMSPDGRCRTFSADARGIVAGDGAGIVVLRRLKDALADGDHVHAVIRGSAVNNDGHHRPGYTAPGVRGQAEVIRTAHAVADVPAGSVSYVEAHGTGTSVGDPIEVAALAQAFTDGGGDGEPVTLGSVKTNIGHTDTAAGVAGLIKTVLALEHRTLPASLHFDEPNPRFDFADGTFDFTTRTRPWTTARLPRRAGVSSFGIGGTNAHAVLEEAPANDPAGARPADATDAHLLVLSARTPSALRAASGRLAEHLRARPELPLGDVAHTLQRGRQAFTHRRYVVSSTADDAARQLAEDSGAGPRAAPQESLVAFFFPDDPPAREDDTGTAAAVRALCAHTAFRDALTACHEALAATTGLDLRAVLQAGAPGDSDASDDSAPRARHASLFAARYATACLLSDWGIDPVAIEGEGDGDLVAACVRGSLPLADAVTHAAGAHTTSVGDPPGTQDVAQTTVPVSDVSRHSGRTASVPPGTTVLRIGPARVSTQSSEASGRAVAGPTASLLDTVGRLWTAGAPIRWERLHEGAERRRVQLPTYPFERREYLVRPDRWTASAPAAPTVAAPPEQAPVPAREGVRRLFQQVLGVPTDVEDPDFFEYGGDSLAAVELIALVDKHLGAALDLEDVFAQATVSGLAVLVERQRADGTEETRS